MTRFVKTKQKYGHTNIHNVTI